MNNEIEYNPFSHKDINHGYQNLDTANRFADYVVKILSDRQLTEAQIVCVDGSSAFLSTFVKSKLSSLWFTFSSKEVDDKIIQINKDIVFVDDYFCRGLATKRFLKKLFWFLEINDIHTISLFFIKSNRTKDFINSEILQTFNSIDISNLTIKIYIYDQEGEE